MSIEINNESGVGVDEESLVALSTHVLSEMGINPLAELSLVVVDENVMAELHEKWMGEPGPTDVLAFPMDELRPGGGARGESEGPADPALLGDVVLCPQVAARQAEEAGHSAQDEIELLCTHGILHLLGYDHAEPEEHKEMFGLQARLLEGWREVRSSR
ncbi:MULTISPECIES: rRNA maturation RNase YbeY [Nonomuraea]|uniref:Endoribonuclease YbeY n=2 Tax=Nonomuraea TaxID=83681 RepID=A0ABW1BTV6_9ACTN|nr:MULTISPECIES: rRNA maturation RNase YbeY [Nonomuraea]MDA0646633.1 rRNA maturation RNase YbeY [Nonomuraea ferruginea]TXK42685.1 rRNA maturation RNase YbeY [Nonomuraea sp. C10]